MPDRSATARPGAVTSPPGANAGPETADDDRPLAFHHLVFQPDGDEVTVGRMDEGTFIVVPADAAELLHRLIEGMTRAEAAAWYRRTYHEEIDVAEFITDLGELGFLRTPSEQEAVAGPEQPVRWARLGRAVFSPVGAVLYLALLAAGAVAMLRSPDLAPTYHQLFFSHYMSLVVVTMYVGQLPLVLLHEAAHALAGRRLGVPSRLTIGRRLYYVVFLTSMNGLVAVPRRKRYLPMLAGMLTDVGVLAALTLVGAATRRADGGFPAVGAIALGLAYMTVLRLLWQCWFFLQTDVYYLIVTVLGCLDLQNTAKQLLSNQWNTLLRRPVRHDPAGWHPRDHQVARWYSVLIVAGYAFSLGTLLIGLLPAAARMIGTVVVRLSGHGPQGGAGLADSVLFLVLILGELAVGGTLYLRERRAARAARRPAAAPSPSTP